MGWNGWPEQQRLPPRRGTGTPRAGRPGGAARGHVRGDAPGGVEDPGDRAAGVRSNPRRVHASRARAAATSAASAGAPLASRAGPNRCQPVTDR
ncbi:hypothetical protein [Carbonactinospora thermoautotrophica]|uniref:hypothetical protein n=1 Tax=Carbonactinospora thermoautotrophica TaxID=1469144 RepID=UPI001FD3F5C7|nr:hypothetical protein [Carbonactinospora thermoautotrophica]